MLMIPALPAGIAAVSFAPQCMVVWKNGVPDQVLACILVTHCIAPAVCNGTALDAMTRSTCEALRSVWRKGNN